MKIEVLCHSSIKIKGEEKVVYIDPFRIEENIRNADIIFITHSHYDHFSEEDINKVKNIKTKICITKDLLEKTIKLGFLQENILVVEPNKEYIIEKIKFNTVPAYNTNKKFHPKENNWVGYLINIEGIKVYIAGDTDFTDENRKIKCDIALIPIGGTYTMTYNEAAELINTIKPSIVIPTHYNAIVGEKEDGDKFKKLINSEIKVELQI